jgi:hypothetical protein
LSEQHRLTSSTGLHQEAAAESCTRVVQTPKSIVSYPPLGHTKNPQNSRNYSFYAQKLIQTGGLYINELLTFGATYLKSFHELAEFTKYRHGEIIMYSKF